MTLKSVLIIEDIADTRLMFKRADVLQPALIKDKYIKNREQNLSGLTANIKITNWSRVFVHFATAMLLLISAKFSLVLTKNRAMRGGTIIKAM